MKYLLFGTGDYYQRYKKWFSKDDIVALLDNSEKKQNTLIDEIMVYSPQIGITLEFDKIVILSFYAKSMKRQLLDLGVSEEQIFHFYDLHQMVDIKRLEEKRFYYGDADKVITECTGKKMLLLSQDLTLGGPAIALMHVAEILIKHGFSVVYGSMLDGPLRKKLLEKKIPVVVDHKLQIATMDEVDWVQDFSMIFCNTINFHIFLTARNRNIPIIWWLHDSSFFYDGIRKENLQMIDRTNLQVLSVGHVPKVAIQKFLPDLEVENLIYGVEDIVKADVEDRLYMTAGGESEKKVCFVTIGYIESRKGQDILIEAVKSIPTMLRKNAIFYFVGQDSSLMAQKIRREIEEMPEVLMTGIVDRAGIDNILMQADMLLCPSREDPMPTVAAEAMMHSVPCIVSDVTGTAKYISNGKNGFTFVSENSEELAAKIEWCVKNRNELKSMGTHARELFEKVFSMEVFEKSILELVSNI